jgi:hypothetical protein
MWNPKVWYFLLLCWLIISLYINRPIRPIATDFSTLMSSACFIYFLVEAKPRRRRHGLCITVTWINNFFSWKEYIKIIKKTREGCPSFAWEYYVGVKVKMIIVTWKHLADKSATLPALLVYFIYIYIYIYKH